MVVLRAVYRGDVLRKNVLGGLRAHDSEGNWGGGSVMSCIKDQWGGKKGLWFYRDVGETGKVGATGEHKLDLYSTL